MIFISLSKEDYYESAIRKALYWLSEDSEWILTVTDKEWKIEITCEASEEINIESKFYRLLNDYLLREKLDMGTLSLKRAIITKSLKDLARNE